MKKRICRSNSGFTLVEMLCTIVVLLLLSALMATGVRLGVFAFRRSVMASESQVLCTTLRTIVNDELRYAGTTETDSSGKVLFFSQSSGKNASFYQNEDGQVMLRGEKNDSKVLSSRAYTYGMQAVVEVKSYDSTTRIFKAAVTVTDGSGKELEKSEFEVKKLNPNP